jgi:hypothetical protein
MTASPTNLRYHTAEPVVSITRIIPLMVRASSGRRARALDTAGFKAKGGATLLRKRKFVPGPGAHTNSLKAQQLHHHHGPIILNGFHGQSRLSLEVSLHPALLIGGSRIYNPKNWLGLSVVKPANPADAWVVEQALTDSVRLHSSVSLSSTTFPATTFNDSS